jgi:hypothetical protein
VEHTLLVVGVVLELLGKTIKALQLLEMEEQVCQIV